MIFLGKEKLLDRMKNCVWDWSIQKQKIPSLQWHKEKISTTKIFWQPQDPSIQIEAKKAQHQNFLTEALTLKSMALEVPWIIQSDKKNFKSAEKITCWCIQN